MDTNLLVSYAAQALEVAGLAAIVLGVATVVTVTTAQDAARRRWRAWYGRCRRGVGLAILLGLELLVGADILRTVAEIPSAEQVLLLGAIVLIRTFLSFTLEVEIEGRWPWQKRRAGEPGG